MTTQPNTTCTCPTGDGSLRWPCPVHTPADSREAAMVVIQRDAEGRPTVWCDPEIADLVKALNAGGIPTVASCSGHGERNGIISLRDGRELIIAGDYESARRYERAIAAQPAVAQEAVGNEHNEQQARALAELTSAAGLMLSEIDTSGHEVDPAYRATLFDAWEQGKAALAASPVVKQNLTTDAAAQEAVAKVGSDHFRSIVDWLGPIPPPNTLLYAAPVTAAPADARSLASALIQDLRAAVSIGRPLQHSDVDEIERALASTPAAPGIDLSKLQRYRMASDANDVRNLHKDDTGTWVKIQDVERALIDASPKGGSDWEATDADIAAWQQRHDLAGAFGSKTDARAAFEDARSAESAAGDAEVQP